MCSHPSPFARPTPRLEDFAREIDLQRAEDPLATVRRINAELFDRLTYSPKSTRVDSPIDDALESRKGVCQDFTHIMIALVRQLGIPCRYVSGYLFHQPDGDVRSPDGSTHAWGEAWLPELGWVGFDPTNNLVADHRHIRVAVGRDYADVPPTRGVFKGASAARSELSVAVRVGTTGQSQSMTAHEVPTHMPWVSREVPSSLPRPDLAQQQQQAAVRTPAGVTASRTQHDAHEDTMLTMDPWRCLLRVHRAIVPIVSHGRRRVHLGLGILTGLASVRRSVRRSSRCGATGPGCR